MITILLIGFLVFSFALLVGFSLPSLLVGLVVTMGVLVVMPQLPSPNALPFPSLKTGTQLLRLIFNLLHFLFDFVLDLALSNFVVAYDVWSPKPRYKPRFIDVPISDLTSFQILVLATRITLTPGTLSVDVSADRETLIVHSMYPKGDGDSESLRRPIEILTRGIQE